MTQELLPGRLPSGVRANGIARMNDSDRAVLICFRDVPTDDDIRTLHEWLSRPKPSDTGVDEGALEDAVGAFTKALDEKIVGAERSHEVGISR